MRRDAIHRAEERVEIGEGGLPSLGRAKPREHDGDRVVTEQQPVLGGLIGNVCSSAAAAIGASSAFVRASTA